ncbi:MAG: MarR family winged helix-turn-helix transcriptional regulator [Telluria sp.]
MKKSDHPASSWPLLLTAQAILTDIIEKRLAAADLPSLQWYDVLWALERAPQRRLRMHELADHVVVSRYHLTRLVDRLAEAGLLRREADPEDRRGAYAVLEEDGAALRRRMWPVYSAAIAELYDAHLGADEQRVLAAALRRVVDAARGT